MKANKLKLLFIAIFCMIMVSFQSNSMENNSEIDCLYDGKPLCLFRTNCPLSVSVSGEERSIYETPSNTQRGGEMTVISNDVFSSHLLESDNFCFQRGDLLIVKYSINIETGGHITLGFLNASRSRWIGSIQGTIFHELGEGLQEGVFKKYVELDDREGTLVIRNSHAGQSRFTIKNIEVKKVLAR